MIISSFAVILVLFIAITAVVLIVTLLYIVERKISRIALRVGMLLVMLVVLSCGAVMIGVRVGIRSTESMIFSSYARAFTDITSHLYQLSASGQYEKLHKDLEILKDELPGAIANHQYTLEDVNNRLFPIEERVNGHIIERSDSK